MQATDSNERRQLPAPEKAEQPGQHPHVILALLAVVLTWIIIFVAGIGISRGAWASWWSIVGLGILAALCAGLLVGHERYKGHQLHREDIADRKHHRLMTQKAIELDHSAEHITATSSFRAVSKYMGPQANITVRDNNLGNALTSPLPIAPPFSSIISQVREGKWCLGYSEAGAVFGSIDDLLSTAIVGRPGTGKTTLLRFVCAQLLKVGGQPILWDPHANIADEVSDLLQCFVEPQEIVTSARSVERTLDHRLKERREGRPPAKTFLLLADEWPVIAALAPGAVDVAKRIVLEGRKVGMYALISGQGLPAKLLDGTLVRDALSSRYVFNTTPQQARLAGLDNDTANTLLALLDTAGPGRAILASSRLKPEIISVPHTTVDDMRSCMSGNGRPPSPEADRDILEQIAFPAQNVSSQEQEQIINLYQQGVPRREICGKLGKGNAYYAIVKAVLDEYESEA